MFSLYVWDDLLKKIEARAKDFRMSKAQVVNQALQEYFKNPEKRK